MSNTQLFILILFGIMALVVLALIFAAGFVAIKKPAPVMAELDVTTFDPIHSCGFLNTNETFDENTLRKVYAALDAADLTNDQVHASVVAMQNAGILFRERKPD